MLFLRLGRRQTAQMCPCGQHFVQPAKLIFVALCSLWRCSLAFADCSLKPPSHEIALGLCSELTLNWQIPQRDPLPVIIAAPNISFVGTVGANSADSLPSSADGSTPGPSDLRKVTFPAHHLRFSFDHQGMKKGKLWSAYFLLLTHGVHSGT